MKLMLLSWFFIFILSCGATKNKNDTISSAPQKEITILEEKDSIPTIIEDLLPNGAITANFISETLPFYAFVKEINTSNGITTIGFENLGIENIHIPEAYGALLHPLRFEGFDRDLLLVQTVYKDPIFRKYYLYILKDNRWKEVVDPFILHVDNITEGFIPIEVNPENAQQMLRSYSVFNLDPTSSSKHGWILNKEVTTILER